MGSIGILGNPVPINHRLGYGYRIRGRVPYSLGTPYMLNQYPYQRVSYSTPNTSEFDNH